MNPPLAEQLGALLVTSKKPAFKVVLIYEDLASGLRGEHIYEKLAAEMDCRCVFHLWSFDVLEIPEIRNLAASAAAAADIVILSLSGRKELCPTVKVWIELWVWLIDRTRPAVATFFDGANGESTPIRAYLRGVIASKQLEFFAHTVFLPDSNQPVEESDRIFSTTETGMSELPAQPARQTAGLCR